MDDLLKSALVGTATQPPPDATHPADAPVAGLDADPERSLLLRAGTRAVWRLAGAVPRRDLAPVEPSPADVTPAVSDRGAALLRAALAGDAKELLPEFLDRLAAAGRRLPPELLPEALSPVARSNELRRLIRPVLGERGRWLARLNPDWSWAAGDDVGTADRDALDRIWNEGSTAERADALGRLRGLDPAEARDRLAATLKDEKAETRAKLVGVLSVGLSMEDEPFLEEALSDRSEVVRAVAVDLLARLPGSRLVARMTARAEAMLAVERGGLLKRKLKLVCAPPQEVDKDWLRDGVPKDAPAGTGIGKRAAWVESVLGCVPPGHWTERFGASPDELIAAAAADDFGDSVLRGWTRAASRRTSEESASPDGGTAAWLRPLAGEWTRRVVGGSGSKADDRRQAEAMGSLRELLGRLPEADADELLVPVVAAADGRDAVRIRPLAAWLLRDLPRPWPNGVSRELLRLIAAARDTADPGRHWWVAVLPTAAAAVPPAVLDETLASCEALLADPDRPFRESVARFAETIRLRREFRREVPS